MNKNDGVLTDIQQEDRIFFPGNPWTNGHVIESFEWTARIEREGLFFDFTLETADYKAEDDQEEDDDDEDGATDWTSKIVWGNYHRCRISSNFWDDAAQGIRITPDGPLHLTQLSGTTLTADALPRNAEIKPAFNVYLLGHDSVADHAITFGQQHGPLQYSVEWTGKIALTYAGRKDFEYTFVANISRAELSLIEVSFDIDEDDEARELFSRYVGEAEQYELHDNIFLLKSDIAAT